MTDDGPEPEPDDAAEVSPSGSPPPSETGTSEAGTPGARTRRGIRIAILAAGVIVAIGTVLVIARARRHGTPVAPIASRGGSAAVRAPEGPHVPGDQANGVHLTGFVVDGAGGPVAGAEVSAELEHGAVDRALVPLAKSDAGVPADAAPAPNDAGATSPIAVAAPTGADGRFAIDGLEPGRYRLRVSGSGLLPSEVRYVPVPSDATRIVVARQVAIDGVVVDGGKPAANVTVGLRGDAIGGEIAAKTDLAGAFHFPNLPEGRYQLYAWQGALAARAVRVNRLGTGPFAAIELRLEAASIVIGRVIDREEGTGIVAAIELRPSGDDQAPRYARSGDDGVFRIEGVPNGRWIADAFAPGYLSPGGVELEAGRGIPELALARGGTLEGRVLDGEGRPVSGATVRALTTGTSATEVSAAVEQDKLRRFSGRMAAPTSVPGLATADPSFVMRGELGVLVGPIPPVPAPGAEVARPAVLDPSVAGLAGEPAPLPVDPQHASIWITGSDGRYRIRGLAKAKVAVLAAAPGLAEGRSKQVALEPGQTMTGIDIVLTAGTMLIGKVTDQHRVPVIGAQITVTPELGAPIEAFTDESGEYRLGPVTGAIEIHASSYGHGDAKRTVEVPAAKGLVAAERREDLVLEVADATLAGTLDDTTGAPVSGAHLEIIGGSGDGRHAIVAADGTFSIDMLPAGHLRMRIAHPAYPSKEVDVVATSGGTERARLRLGIGGGVEGVLLEATSGAPLTSIAILAAGPSSATADATSDKVGRWKLGPLEPGHWKVTISLPGYLPLARELDVPAARAPGTMTVRDVRLELARGALVGGTVRDARGQRIAGAKVTARPANGSGPTVEGVSDVAGEFRLRDSPTGELEVSASRGDLSGMTRATVRPGDEVLGLSIDLR
jgi:hypothetical protein